MFTDRDYKFFNVAKSISELSTHNRYSIGCVLISGGDIISTGINSNKTHPIQKRFNSFRGFNNDKCHNFLHAETDALRKIKFIIPKKTSIYICRTMRDNTKNISVARPCNACIEMLGFYGIQHIYYSTEFGLAYERLI